MLSRSAKLALALFCGVYALAIFPWAFFRHDDWLILGNAVNHLPRDWGFLWRATLFFNDVEGDWFFRPFFKLGTYVFFQLFHFHYILWLGALLVCNAAAIALGYAAIQRLTGSTRRATLFVILFTCAVHLHFASLVWMGEGMMNSPQLLLMALAVYAFARGWNVLSTSAYALSLGFKESSLVLPALLAAVTWQAAPWRNCSWRDRARALAPHAIVGIAYTVLRFGFMRMNGSYAPHPFATWAWPAIGLVAALLAPLALACWRGRETLRGLAPAARSGWVYLPFLALLIAPYFGHPFFSPGWLLLPGFFTLFVASLVDMPEPRAALWPIGLATFLVCAAPVGWQTVRLGWWQWQQPQRIFLHRLQAADPQVTRKLHICVIPNPRYPQTTLDRVIGFDDGIEELWEVLHHTPLKVEVTYCENDDRARLPASADALSLQWNFPELSTR